MEYAKILANIANDYFLVLIILLSSCVYADNTNTTQKEGQYNKNSNIPTNLNWDKSLLIEKRKDFQDLFHFLQNHHFSPSRSNNSNLIVLNILEIIFRIIDGSQPLDTLEKLFKGNNISSNSNSINSLSTFMAVTIDKVTNKTICSYEDSYRQHLPLPTALDTLNTSTYISKLDASNTATYNSIGYRRKDDFIMMDNIEELLFLRTYLETISLQDGSTNTGSLNNGSNNNNNNDNTNTVTKPLSWVDNIGIGQKDWEKVIGYYRFSDIYTSTDNHYICTGIPYTKYCFLDLSKFGNLLECYSSNETSTSNSHSTSSSNNSTSNNPSNNSNIYGIILEKSTSPCDTGNGHNTVKDLYDIVFKNSTTTTAAVSGATQINSTNNNNNNNNSATNSSGIRCIIGRGGSLDCGLLHKKENNIRNKLTVEMWVQFPSHVSLDNNTTAAATAAATTGNSNDNSYFQQILMMRCYGGPGSSSSSSNSNNNIPTTAATTSTITSSSSLLPMWILHTNNKGEICFTICDPFQKDTKKLPTNSLSVPWLDNSNLIIQSIIVPSEYVTTENFNLSEWNHFVITLDSSSGNHNKVTVNIILNGKSASKGSLLLPHIEDEKLDITTLYIGYNLTCDCRMTELRFHADCKNEDDINNSRFNYLGNTPYLMNNTLLYTFC